MNYFFGLTNVSFAWGGLLRYPESTTALANFYDKAGDILQS